LTAEVKALKEEPMTHDGLRLLALAGVVALVVLLAPRVTCADEGRAPEATIVVSSSPVASAVGLTLVEGSLRLRDKRYLLTLRGAQPSIGSTGKVYGIGQARDIEGAYTRADGGLRNDRGVTIVFDPPLDLPDGKLRIELSSRVYPQASTGPRGTVD